MRVEIVNQLSPPGLAGMICKRINNKVLVYGGSYFPENEPLKTSKVQSNRIYVYDDEFKLLYEQEGKIYPDKGIIIHENNIIYYIQSSSIYKISLTDKVEEECLGNFDFEIESGYGCKKDQYLFFGHKQSFQFNLLTGELIRKKDFPVEGRAQGVSVLYKNELYYLGGANYEAYTNGYKYNFENNDWKKIDYRVPHSVLGAATIQLTEKEVLILGGFNQDVYNQAIIDLKQPGYREEYFSNGKNFFKWNQEIYLLNIENGAITILGKDERFALCGAGFIKVDNNYYIISGECSPGRRAAEILLVKELI